MPDNIGEVILRVKSKKDPGYVKIVAGAMSWQLRENGFFKVRAVKADAVNTAIKAIAIVNQRIIPLVTLSIDLCFAETSSDQDVTAMAMTVSDADCPRPAEFVQYRVSGKQEEENATSKLAGSMANLVREGKGVSLRCIGANAVYRGVLASTIAKGYICTNGLESIVVPTWGSFVHPEKGPISLIQIDFWGKKVS